MSKYYLVSVITVYFTRVIEKYRQKEEKSDVVELIDCVIDQEGWSIDLFIYEHLYEMLSLNDSDKFTGHLLFTRFLQVTLGASSALSSLSMIRMVERLVSH